MNQTHSTAARIWERPEEPYPRDERGYLEEPTETRPPLDTLERLEGVRVLALIGDPGMGKSTDLARYCARDARRHRFELREYGSSEEIRRLVFGRPELVSALEAGQTVELVLDGLDESLLIVRNAQFVIMNELRDIPVEQLRLRIACRSSDWPASLDTTLRERFGGEYQLRRLAPLSRAEVRSILADPDAEVAFFQALFEKGLSPLAATPLTLNFLIDEIREKGTLSGARHEIYRNGCYKLVSESSDPRRELSEPTSPSDRWLVAQRIAAVCLLGRRMAVDTRPDAGAVRGRSAVLFQALLDGVERQGEASAVAVTPRLLKETLGSGLFQATGTSYRWRHWSYAEYLTSEFLLRRGITGEDAIEVLASADGQGGHRIAPSYRDLAAWMTRDVSTCRAILKRDPEALLDSAAVCQEESARAQLTDVVLDLAQTQELEVRTLYGPYNFDVFEHEELDAKLRGVLGDRRKGERVRIVAALLSGRGRRDAVKPELRAIVDTTAETPELRKYAARALQQMATKEDEPTFRGLLAADIGDDQDELRGVALAALWPDYISADELFARHLTEPKRRSVFGAYDYFIWSDIVPKLRPSVLPVAVRWAATRFPTNGLERLDSLAEKIVERAWAAAPVPALTEALAGAVASAMKHLASTLPADSGGARDDLRRAVCVKLLASLSSRGLRLHHLTMSRPPLARPSDIEWLVGELRRSEDGLLRGLLAALIDALFSAEDDLALEVVLRANDELEELRQATENKLFLRIGSEEAQRAKATYEEHLAWQRERDAEQSEVEDPTLVDHLRAFIRAFDEGDTHAWWRLNLDLCFDRYGRPRGNELEADLRKLPGWEVLSTDDHRDIARQAREYLRRQDPDTKHWLGTSTFHRPAAAGYRALHLLITSDDADLDELVPDIWKKWAPAVIAFPNPLDEARDARGRLTLEAYRRAPEAFLGALNKLVDDEAARGTGHLFVLRRLEKCWDENLVAAMEAKARSRTLGAESIGSMFDEMLPHTDAATAAALRLLELTVADIPLAVALLTHRPAEMWQVHGADLLTASDFSRSTWLRYAYQSRRDGGALADALGADVVASVYLMLDEQFPRDQDPDFDGVHQVTDREAVASLRDALLMILEVAGTDEAVVALERIRRERPQHAWLGATLARGRLQAAERNSRERSVEDIVALGRSADPVLRRIRVFIASSSDVAEERRVANEVIKACDIEFRERGLAVDSYAWEEQAFGLHANGPQALIDPHLEESKIVVWLVGDRVGEGTKHEVRWAYERQLQRGSPILLVFGRGRSATRPSAVAEFLKEVPKVIDTPFEATEELRRRLQAALREKLGAFVKP